LSFFRLLRQRAEQVNSWVCVGLDPVRDRLPEHLRSDPDGILRFLRQIIESTIDVVCCYKPNLAFYLAEGAAGVNTLEKVRQAIPAGVPVILDAKVGDVGNTAAAYAKATFETWDFDAVTVNPYVGDEAVLPFAAYRDRGVYVLARTSNANSHRFQSHHDLAAKVVASARSWNTEGNIGLVVGATHPSEIERARALAPELPFLIPGIGAQGGDVEAAVAYGPSEAGVPPVINSSRGILYASEGKDFAEAARRSAIKLRDEIQNHLEGARESA